MYEVELKFPLPQSEAVLAVLQAWGAQRGSPLEQVDEYFNHPCRDFAQTDEALRIRRHGTSNRATYKGPLLDTQTKTRREIEFPLGDGAQTAADCRQALVLLGFRPVRSVQKLRVPYALERHGREFELALDDVAGLGTFIEIETLADEAGREAAQTAIRDLAVELGLTNSERRSYLSLLIEQDAQVQQDQQPQSAG